MPEFIFINPIDKLLRMIKNGNIDRQDISPLFTEELKEFTKKWFPNFEKHVFELFTLYHNKILCRLGYLFQNLENLFSYYRPVVLLYSISANKIYEDVCAYLANKKGVPIFYFQHGGAGCSAFCYHPYQRYFEQNKNIKKINIFQSRIEKEFSIENISSESRALGSIGFITHTLYTKKRFYSKIGEKFYIAHILFLSMPIKTFIWEV